MSKDKPLKLPEPWNPPHEDAELFINDVINGALRIMQEGTVGNLDSHSGEVDLDEGTIELRRRLKIDPDQSVPPRKRDSEDDYIEDDFSYLWWEELEDTISFENVAERNELIAMTRDALNNGDPEEIVASLDRFLDSYPEPIQLPGYNEVYNWANVLVSGPAEGAPEETEESRAEQELISAIQDLCVRLCEIIARDPRILWQIEWRELERIISTSLSGIGFDVELTPGAKDGGKDIVAGCVVRGFHHTYFVEVKHWRSGKRVGAPVVCDFVEVNAINRTDGALLLSSSGFTTGVYSQFSELEKRHLRLGGEEKIVSLCQHFVRRDRGFWKPTSTLPEILFERTISPYE